MKRRGSLSGVGGLCQEEGVSVRRRGSLSGVGVSVKSRGLCQEYGVSIRCRGSLSGGGGFYQEDGVSVRSRGLCQEEGSLSGGGGLCQEEGVSVRSRGLCQEEGVSVYGVSVRREISVRRGSICLSPIRRMSGWYASYCNTLFLFLSYLTSQKKKSKESDLLSWLFGIYFLVKGSALF